MSRELLRPLPLTLLNVKMPPMTYRQTLLLMTCVTLFAFGIRAVSLDAQSMWRDEIDTLCFSLDFWEVLEQAARPGLLIDSQPTARASVDEQGVKDAEPASPPASRLDCQPAPGMGRVDATQGLWPALRGLLTLQGWNGTLYTFAMRPWIDLTGDSPFALRFNSLLFGVLVVPLAYVLGQRLFGPAVGLVAAALVALSPHLVWYSQEAKMYGPILALGLLAVYSLRRAVDSEGSGAGWWAVMVVATTVALYAHILTALFIPLEVVLALIWWPRTRGHWRGALVSVTLLTLPYLPLLAWQGRTWLRPAGEATLFTIGRLDVMLEATFEGWGGNFVTEPWATLVLAGLALLALFAVARIGLSTGQTERQEREEQLHDWRDLTSLLVWIFLPMFGIWLISMRQPIFTNRYLIWAAPAFYLLAAAGFVALVRAGRGGALVGGALLLVVLLGDARALLHQASQPIKPDFKATAAYLEETYQPGDLIVFHLSYMENNFDYYYQGKFDGWGAPAPASGLSESDIDLHMRAQTSGRPTVWLVLSEAGMWDPQGMIKAWMDDHAVVPPEEKAFVHVSVYRYELKE